MSKKQPSSPPQAPVKLRSAIAHAGEEERFLLLGQWWRDNWLSIVGGVFLGMLLLSAWYIWQERKDTHYEMANTAYFKFIEDEVIAEDLTELDQYEDTPYPALVRLEYARFSVEQDEPDKAIEYLFWVMDNRQGSLMAEVARIRWLRILLMQKKYQDVLNNANLFDYGTYTRFAFEEIRGDAYAGLGDTRRALEAYSEAQKILPSPNNLLELKISALRARG